MISPRIGLTHRSEILVEPALTVPHLATAFGAMTDMPPVFATAYMIGFIEATCIEALAPYLEPGEATVGTDVNVSHVAATPVGLTVTAEVTLEAIDGRKLRFRARCHDGQDVVGEGVHERIVIDRDRFLARTTAKVGKESVGAAPSESS